MVQLNKPLDPEKTGRRAASLESNLRRMIVGQDEAIQQIVNIYQLSLTGMSAPDRPIGNFLFLGPTGSGKTRIVEATAEALLKNPRAVIKDRLRRVPAQPRNREAGRLPARISGTSRDPSYTFAGNSESKSHRYREA